MKKSKLPAAASVAASVASETEHLIEERIELLEWKLNGDFGIKV